MTRKDRPPTVVVTVITGGVFESLTPQLAHRSAPELILSDMLPAVTSRVAAFTC